MNPEVSKTVASAPGIDLGKRELSRRAVDNVLAYFSDIQSNPSPSPQHTILLDMDGVLVEFVRGSFKFHGKSIPIKDVRWNFPEQIGFDGTWSSAFWNPLGYEFWANLEWTAEGKELLAGLEEIFGEEIVIVSSPCLTRGCRDGKGDWVDKHIPHFRKRTFLGGEKHRLAAPNKILLDDHQDNIDAFAKRGGKTVLIPRPWNRRREETCENGFFNIPQILEEVRALLQ